MKKLFPPMMEIPSAQAMAGGIPYWFFAFFFIPAIMMFSSGGTWGESYVAWMEIGCHIINFIVMFIFFFTYMKDSFLVLQVNTREVLSTAGIAVALIVVLKVVTVLVSLFCGNDMYANAAFGSFLTSETDLLYYSTAVIDAQPLWGTLCFVVLSPVTTACLLYASIFAPVCERKPWLAYLVMAALLLIKHLSLAFCLWPIQEEMAIFLVTLPAHLIACWSYQKTDTVWTPILVHGVSNLLLALLAMWAYGNL